MIKPETGGALVRILVSGCSDVAPAGGEGDDGTEEGLEVRRSRGRVRAPAPGPKDGVRDAGEGFRSHRPPGCC